MQRIGSGRGFERLQRLVRQQLGHELAAESDKTNTTAKAEVSGADFSQRHQQLASRSGAELELQTGYQQLTVLQRAQRRERMQKERQQNNLEQVMRLTQDYCPEHVASLEVDPDWFQQYCDLVLNISNPGMQQLWAKILAGEIGRPGSFSLRTLFLLHQMSYKEALALQRAASLTCKVRQQDSGHIYFGYLRSPSVWQFLTGRSKAVLNLSQFGLTYPQILSLIEVNLLHPSEIESGALDPATSLDLWYHQQQLQLKAKVPGLVLQYYKFTPMGTELLPLLSSQPNSNYLQALKQLLGPVIQFD
ncbi:TIGR03899 family protein [Rheinheimera marina]|uniref:TIGR03899 family protein n=1 Tax=Rheinheimera marina TaxID=1774958 RepID=A0ABV9JMV9_9GAMM